MKNTEISWRSVIGGFNGGKAKKLAKLCSTSFICPSFDFKNSLAATVLFALLIIGNVEINPGPQSIRSTEITLRMVMNEKKRHPGNLNIIHKKSVWGGMAQNLLGVNDFKARKLMSHIFDAGKKFPQEKYSNITWEAVSTAAFACNTQISDCVSFSSNWKQIATNLFGTTSYADKQFFLHIWNAYNEYQPNPTQQNEKEQTGPMSSNSTDIERETGDNTKRRHRSVTSQIVSYLSRIVLTDHNVPPDQRGESWVEHSLIVERLSQEFANAVAQYPTAICRICHKLSYFSLMVMLRIGPIAHANLSRLGENISTNSQIRTCTRCYSNLMKEKVPPQALCNKLELIDLPTEIKELTVAEIAFIKQIKLFMRIILLNNGRGQRALQGMAVHFPQDVEDVIEQLPLDKTQADLIYVTEQSESQNYEKTYPIRPEKLSNALHYLKQNNPLYANIQITARTEEELSPNIVIIPADNNVQHELYGSGINGGFGFTEMRNQSGASILRASVNQSNPIFQPYSGMQCTAMSAVFLAHCIIENPSTWTRETLDSVLTNGNQYYAEKRPFAGEDHLQTEEIRGTINSFGELLISIDPVADPEQLFQGYFNKYPGPHLNRLPQQINLFLHSGQRCAIFQAQGYSMGIFLDNSSLYYFDSHSRTALGGCAADGKACVIKYPNLDAAPSKLSALIHRNLQLKTKDFGQPFQYVFTITPIMVTMIEEHNSSSDSSDNEDEIQTPTHSPRKKKSKSNHVADNEYDEKLSEDDEQNEVEDNVLPKSANEFIRRFDKQMDMDCVITEDDFNEPLIEDYNPNHVTLKRRNRSPINSSVEKNLELLAFPHLFPEGINGLNEERPINITPLDYFQQRLMSGYKRFASSSEYLFYALNECDRHRAFQKISVCCNMQRQEGGDLVDEDRVVNPHLYMSAVRGTQAYWKKFNGDLIAMIKSLGVPTFFLTFSFDDLNSFHVVNALYKAEHGEDAEVIPDQLSYDERKKLLMDHPITAARTFSMRLTKFFAFIEKHAVELFGRRLQDYSARVEFQVRGSPHLHMVMWLENAPEWTSPEGIEFLNRNISCSLSTTYSEVVLKYQKHRHSHTCFKRKDGRCRFNFPISPSEVTSVLDEEDIHRNGGRFIKLKRTESEAMINNYHPILLRILKCNMDIQAVTGAMAIAFYIAKYISKSEPQQIQTEIQEAIQKINESEVSARDKMCRIAVQIMKRRQVSAQEAAFRLCHLFLRKSSRATVFLPTYQKTDRLRMIRKETLPDETQRFCLNVIDRYIARPHCLENISLFEFASHYQPVSKNIPSHINDEDVEEFAEEPEIEIQGRKEVFRLLGNNGKVFKRSKAAVIKTPNFNPIADRENYYYSLLLMYLPFRVENFCDEYESVEKAFQELHVRLRRNSDDPCIHPELAVEFDQALLRATEFSFNERSGLGMVGSFEMDYSVIEEDHVTQEEAFPEPPANLVEEIRNLISQLNADQRRVFERFRFVVNELCHNKVPPHLRLIVQGEGGSGKTFTINLLSKFIKHSLGRTALILSAPTGKSAHAINAMTLHRAFSLPVEIDGIGMFRKLGARTLHNLRELYKHVKFIIIDEMSLISYETLRMVHLRLCEIFDSDDPFANRHICLMGDLLQMKCPRGSYIFKKPLRFNAEIHLWRLFDFIELNINERQIGMDPLLTICRHLRVGAVTEEDIRLLQTKVLHPSNSDYQKKMEEFKDCIWAFPTKKLAARYNKIKSEELKRKLAERGERVYTINAKDTYADPGFRFGRECPKSVVPKNENKTAGIPSSIDLGLGSRVMLRRNKDVDAGMVNGAVGTVVGFEWNYGRIQPVHGDLPLKLNVQYDHCQIPQWTPPTNVEFFGKKKSRINRRMLPYILSFGQNFHKLQGVSVDQIVVDLGPKLFAKGMAYVGLSRCRTFAGLAISDLDLSKLITTDKYNPCDLVALEELERLRAAFPVS